MGHQESYLYLTATKYRDIQDELLAAVLSLLKRHGIRGPEDDECECVCKVELLTDAPTTSFTSLTKPTGTQPAGAHFLYFSGERSGMRSIARLFYMDKQMYDETVKYIPQEMELISCFDIMFAEYMPSHEIFAEDSKMARVIDVEWDKVPVDTPLPEVLNE